MRNVIRLSLAGAVVGAVSVIGVPAALAQTAAECAYPFDNCDDFGGGTVDGATGDGGAGGDVAGGGTLDAAPARGGALPFTGGETVLLGATGLGALAGGAALVIAGRRRVASA